MSTIQHQSEGLRRAVKWVSDERQYNTGQPLQKIMDEAISKFDLSPLEAEFLTRFVKEEAGKS